MERNKQMKIYNMIRDIFHSQSGLFLNKKQAMDIAVSIYNMTNQNKDEQMSYTAIGFSVYTKLWTDVPMADRHIQERREEQKVEKQEKGVISLDTLY